MIMNKFYKLRYSIDEKVIGRAEGLKSCHYDKDFFAKDSFINQGLWGPVEGSPGLPNAVMHKSVKMTDVIDIVSLSPEYLIITKKFLDFLIPYFNTSYQTWKISIKKGDVDYEYYIFHLDFPKNDFINHEKSIYKIFEYDENYNRIDLNQEIKAFSDVDLLEKRRKYLPLGIRVPFLETVKFAINSNSKEDFFRSSTNGMTGYYVSEKLKQEIENQGFTGIDFVELDKINNFVEIEMV